MLDAVIVPSRWCALVLVASVSGGCGGARYAPTTLGPAGARLADAQEVRSYRLVDPAHLRFEQTRASELFAAALAAHGRGDLERAATLYDRLAAEFASSRYRDAARYNAALVDVERERADAALARLRRVLLETSARAPERLAAELLFARVVTSEPLRGPDPAAEGALRAGAASRPCRDDVASVDPARAEPPRLPPAAALRREARAVVDAALRRELSREARVALLEARARLLPAASPEARRAEEELRAYLADTGARPPAEGLVGDDPSASATSPLDTTESAQ